MWKRNLSTTKPAAMQARTKRVMVRLPAIAGGGLGRQALERQIGDDCEYSQNRENA